MDSILIRNEQSLTYLTFIYIKKFIYQEESLSVMKNFHHRQACLYFIYKVISIEAPKSNFQGIPLLSDLPVDKKRVMI